LNDTVSARALAGGLVAAAQFPERPGQIDSIAYTLLGIAAYGGGLRTVTDLESPSTTNHEFKQYWRNEFYKPDQAGPALSSPDPSVLKLLSGLLAARDRDTTWRIVDEYRPAKNVQHSGPALIDVDQWNLQSHIVVTYDARLAPEVPVVITHGTRTGALHYYAADLTHPNGSHAVGAYLGCGIGITDADDAAVLAARDRNTATLTHWIGSTAIYTPAQGLPRRVYLPGT